MAFWNRPRIVPHEEFERELAAVRRSGSRKRAAQFMREYGLPGDPARFVFTKPKTKAPSAAKGVPFMREYGLPGDPARFVFTKPKTKAPSAAKGVPYVREELQRILHELRPEPNRRRRRPPRNPDDFIIR